MAKLTAKTRNGLDTASFALPGRKYPIEDASHARNALARASQHASPAQQATIKAKVHAKYPSIGAHLAKGGPVQSKLRMAPHHKGKSMQPPAASLQTPGVGTLPAAQPAIAQATPPVNIHGIALAQPMSMAAQKMARG